MSKQSFSSEALPGAVCVQWRRCGKLNCQCRNGKLHGPYYYRFWRVGGKLRKAYVRPERLEEVREAVARWRQMQTEHRFGRLLWSRASRRSRELILEALAQYRQ